LDIQTACLYTATYFVHAQPAWLGGLPCRACRTPGGYWQQQLPPPCLHYCCLPHSTRLPADAPPRHRAGACGARGMPAPRRCATARAQPAYGHGRSPPYPTLLTTLDFAAPQTALCASAPTLCGRRARAGWPGAGHAPASRNNTGRYRTVIRRRCLPGWDSCWHDAPLLPHPHTVGGRTPAPYPCVTPLRCQPAPLRVRRNAGSLVVVVQGTGRARSWRAGRTLKPLPAHPFLHFAPASYWRRTGICYILVVADSTTTQKRHLFTPPTPTNVGLNFAGSALICYALVTNIRYTGRTPGHSNGMNDAGELPATIPARIS